MCVILGAVALNGICVFPVDIKGTQKSFRWLMYQKNRLESDVEWVIMLV